MTNKQRAIKSKIQINKQFIEMSKKTIKKEYKKRTKYEKEIKRLQDSCKHDFFTTGAFAGVSVECKICGYIGGA